MKESNKHIYMCVTRPGIMARWDADKRKADDGEPGDSHTKGAKEAKLL